MTVTTLTAVQPAPNTGSPTFIDDTTSSSCLHLGTPFPSSISLTNLDASSYNGTLGPLNLQCQFLAPYPNFTLVAGVPRVLSLVGAPASSEAVVLAAPDVGPGTYHVRADGNQAPSKCQ